MFKNMLSLTDRRTVTDWLAAALVVLGDGAAELCELWISLSVVPERYETNAGIMGSMHGEKNEPAPASADTMTLVSTPATIQFKMAKFCINTLFQIYSRSYLPRFLTSLLCFFSASSVSSSPCRISFLIVAMEKSASSNR